MKKVLIISMCLLCILASLTLARRPPKGTELTDYELRRWGDEGFHLNHPQFKGGFKAVAQEDTTWLASYTFDSGPGCVDEGWISVDLTAQTGCYFHVDDFAGLGGGGYGLLVPLEGSQSAWCGARPDTASTILCGYATLPGYGNNWDQGWCFTCIDVPDTEEVYIEYLAAWFSEPGYDYTYVEYATKSTCDSLTHPDVILGTDWTAIHAFDGGSWKIFVRDTIPSGHRGAIKIRFHFMSDMAWSDEDGLFNSDGAFLVDSITVRSEEGTFYDFEDFEDESPGDLATTDGDWSCCVMSGYGDFASLYPGMTLVQEDLCTFNMSCVWAFINGSTETYACGGFPAQIAVPKQNERGQYLKNEVWSPKIPWVGSGSQAGVRVRAYADLPFDNAVFMIWLVRSWVGSCPGPWRNDGSFYYGPNKTWLDAIIPFGTLIEPGATHIQVAFGAWDLCWWAGPIFGTTCACHTHAPFFDDVKVFRVATQGPQWFETGRFSDTFPADGTITGTGRADAFRDSITVIVSDVEAGIGTDSHTGFGAAVYCCVSVKPNNYPATALQEFDPAQAPPTGEGRWPLVDSLNACGMTWYKLRMDTAFTQPNRQGAAPDEFCFDLNDNLFTAGDTVLYFFHAESDTGWAESYFTEATGTTGDLEEAACHAMEFQILPGGGYNNGGDILYVNDMFGFRLYFDAAFEMMGIDDLVDRFDGRNGGLRNRVVDITQQLIPVYRKIIYETWMVRENDFYIMNTFLDQHDNPSGAGVYMLGDDISQNWGSGFYATTFKGSWINHDLTSSDHLALGFDVSPLVIAEPSSMFQHPITGADSMVAFGGCPYRSDFDVFTPTGSATLEMTYGGTGSAMHGAVIAQASSNALGNPVGVVLSGFYFPRIRDDVPAGIPDAVDHLTDIIRWLGNILDDPTGAGNTPQYTNGLAQNYPNPFNPSTTIKYSIKERAHMTLKIYNVAGQLVKTLVNEEKRAGEYTKGWNGLDNAGNPVSSGVYFYRLATKNYTQTKKMVLLK